ncbi:SRPBCC family protein [Mumia quercus]|uniref:SRPBCC family protein n=1 Tax=Mumia quercus TaxID=2976125 RepID=UPI0021D326D9|nr:SRPBCC family protein [Mumia quercus]
MKDMLDEITAVRRKVADGTLPAGEAKVVALSRTYDAPVEDVWDAVTNPERIPRWFLPISGDLRLGGTYQLEGNAGGEIRVCDSPRRLVVTWVMGEPTPEDTSLVEVRLEPVDEKTTRLDLEHTAVVPPEMWDQFGPGATGVGWDLALLGLWANLNGIPIGSPEQMDKDPDVRACMTASSDAWGEALAATGATPEDVTAKVTATTAFYVPPLG